MYIHDDAGRARLGDSIELRPPSETAERSACILPTTGKRIGRYVIRTGMSPKERETGERRKVEDLDKLLTLYLVNVWPLHIYEPGTLDYPDAVIASQDASNSDN